MSNEKQSFLKRKNVIISFKRYGLMRWDPWHWDFCVTVDRYDHQYDRAECVSGKLRLRKTSGDRWLCNQCDRCCNGTAIGHALQAPPLVMYSLCAVGSSLQCDRQVPADTGGIFCGSHHL